MRFDPMGVADFPEAADEYDAYAGQMLTMLRSGQATTACMKQLVHQAVGHMGLVGDPIAVADFIAQVLSDDWP